jgi:hypothetical protein
MLARYLDEHNYLEPIPILIQEANLNGVHLDPKLGPNSG